jgi:tetratricopeptide (TPR) repeat protein
MGESQAREFMSRGRRLRRDGDVNASIPEFEQAVAEFGTPSESSDYSLLGWICLNYALALREQGNLEQALHYFNEAVNAVLKHEAARPDYNQGHYRHFFYRANLRVVLGDEGAASDYEEVLRRGRDVLLPGIIIDVSAPQDTAIVLADTKQAMTVLRQKELAYFASALAKQIVKDWDGALSDLEAALQAAPQNELLAQRVKEQRAQVETLRAEEEAAAKKVSPYTPHLIKPDTEYYNVTTDLEGGYFFNALHFSSTHQKRAKRNFASREELDSFAQEFQAKLIADGWRHVADGGGRGSLTRYYQRKR